MWRVGRREPAERRTGGAARQGQECRSLPCSRFRKMAPRMRRIPLGRRDALVQEKMDGFPFVPGATGSPGLKRALRCRRERSEERLEPSAALPGFKRTVMDAPVASCGGK